MKKQKPLINLKKHIIFILFIILIFTLTSCNKSKIELDNKNTTIINNTNGSSEITDKESSQIDKEDKEVEEKDEDTQSNQKDIGTIESNSNSENLNINNEVENNEAANSNNDSNERNNNTNSNVQSNVHSNKEPENKSNNDESKETINSETEDNTTSTEENHQNDTSNEEDNNQLNNYPLQPSPITGEFNSDREFYSALLDNGYYWGVPGGPYLNQSKPFHQYKHLDYKTIQMSWDMAYDDITPRENIVYSVYTDEAPYKVDNTLSTIENIKKYGNKIQSNSLNRSITRSFNPGTNNTVYVIAIDSDKKESTYIIQGIRIEDELTDPIPGNNGVIKVENTGYLYIKSSWAPVTNYPDDGKIHYHFRVMDKNTNEQVFNDGPAVISQCELNFTLPPGEYRIELTAHVTYDNNPSRLTNFKSDYETTYFKVE